jgi:hypothetical protein
VGTRRTNGGFNYGREFTVADGGAFQRCTGRNTCILRLADELRMQSPDLDLQETENAPNGNMAQSKNVYLKYLCLLFIVVQMPGNPGIRIMSAAWSHSTTLNVYVKKLLHYVYYDRR